MAYWEGDGDARIVWGTGAGYLIAVDAGTGVPAAEFGDNGRVDLIADLPRSPRGQPFRLPVGSRSAAPLIVGDTIVVGTNHTDFTISREGPPGFIFAHDVRTGKRLWEFHIVPQSADEFGADTWEDESWRYTGNGNAWGNLSADPELGYDLPGGGIGSPMTYLLDGRQYLALTVGGRVPELIAFRLPIESDGTASER